MTNKHPQPSSLLLTESPLCIQPTLAVAIGLNEAIFLQQCHYWLNPKFNKNFIEGKYWVHKTLQQWAEEFPFWGDKTIRRIISNLENLKIIISNVTSNGFTKTKFFTIDYEVLNEHTSSKPAEKLGAVPCGQNDRIDLPKRADGSGHNDRIDVDNMAGSYKEERLPTENTSLSQNQTSFETSLPVSMKVERDVKNSISKEMLAVWNELIPEKATNANSYLLSKLELALRDQLNGDISSWRTVCENFRSSKFLMGEVEHQRLNPSLSWLVDSKEPRVSRVFEKQHYTFGDRTIVSPHAQEIKTLEVKNNQLLLQKQIIENDLARIEDERKEAEKRFVSEKVKALSPEELETYKTQYEALMTEKGEVPFTLQEGRAGRMAQFMFELFLEKQVKESLSENCIDFSAFVKKETELKKEKEELKALYDQGIQAVAEFRNGSAGMFPEKQRAMQ